MPDGERWAAANSGPDWREQKVPQPSPLVGKTLRIAEDDYKFGTGELVLRIDAVLGTQEFGDGVWVYVRGRRIRSDGSPGAQRQVLVRRAIIRTALARS